MLSKLAQIVSDIAEQKEIEIEEWNMKKIKKVETNLNDTGDVETAMVELDKILGYKWDKFYGQIKHNLERNK